METETEIKEWWYELNGEQRGPIDGFEVQTLIRNSILKRDNLIWKKGMDEWKPIYYTEFGEYFKHDTPPPIVGEAVDNTIVWWLAFAPFIGQFLEGVFLSIFYPAPEGGNLSFYTKYYSGFHQFWFVTLGLNIWLCLLDEKALKKAGHDTRGELGSAWLIPVYLFKRAKVLRQNNAYLWVWLVTFILTLVS
jgi:hypothetical protein